MLERLERLPSYRDMLQYGHTSTKQRISDESKMYKSSRVHAACYTVTLLDCIVQESECGLLFGGSMQGKLRGRSTFTGCRQMTGSNEQTPSPCRRPSANLLSYSIRPIDCDNRGDSSFLCSTEALWFTLQPAVNGLSGSGMRRYG